MGEGKVDVVSLGYLYPFLRVSCTLYMPDGAVGCRNECVEVLVYENALLNWE